MVGIKDQAKRVLFLDYIRGIAALLVVCSHSFETFVPSFHYVQTNIFNIGMIGVVAFFLVSGFVIPFSLERYKSIRLFANSRFFRIYPLYIIIFIITAVQCCFGIIAGWDTLKHKLLSNIIIHAFFIQDYLPKEKFGIVNLVGGAWTLFIEMIWYIMFAVIYKVRLNKKNELVLLIANTILLSLTLLSIFSHVRIPPGRYILLFCCFVGLFVYRYFSGTINKRTFLYILIISFLNIYFSLYVGFGIYINGAFTTACVLNSYSIAFLICLLFYTVGQRLTNDINALLSFIGRISYSLYLAHNIIIFCLEKVGMYPLFGIVSVLISTLFAYILYIYIEKPGVELGKKIAKKINVRPQSINSKSIV